MNSRKENETTYQDTTVELNDEALEKVFGGSSEYRGDDWNHHADPRRDWDWDWCHHHGNHDWDWRRRR